MVWVRFAHALFLGRLSLIGDIYFINDPIVSDFSDKEEVQVPSAICRERVRRRQCLHQRHEHDHPATLSDDSADGGFGVYVVDVHCTLWMCTVRCGCALYVVDVHCTLWMCTERCGCALYIVDVHCTLWMCTVRCGCALYVVDVYCTLWMCTVRCGCALYVVAVNYPHRLARVGFLSVKRYF